VSERACVRARARACMLVYRHMCVMHACMCERNECMHRWTFVYRVYESPKVGLPTGYTGYPCRRNSSFCL